MIRTKTFRSEELQTTVRGWMEPKRKGEDNILYTQNLAAHVVKGAVNSRYLSKIPSLANFRFDQSNQNGVGLDHKSPVVSLSGVFDGHGGKFASEFVAEMIPFFLFAMDEYRSQNYEAALKRLLLVVHTALRAFPEYTYEGGAQSASGTTVSLVLTTADFTYVASAGDSPIIIFDRHGQVYHVGACHNRLNPDCRQIILSSGMPLATRIESGADTSNLPLCNRLSGFRPYPSPHNPLPPTDRPLPPMTILGSGLNVFGGVGDAWSDPVIYNPLFTAMKIFCKKRAHRLDKYLSTSTPSGASGTPVIGGGTSGGTGVTGATSGSDEMGIAAKFAKFFAEEYASADREGINRIINIPKLAENKYFYNLLLAIAESTKHEEEHLQKYYGKDSGNRGDGNGCGNPGCRDPDCGQGSRKSKVRSGRSRSVKVSDRSERKDQMTDAEAEAVIPLKSIHPSPHSFGFEYLKHDPIVRIPVIGKFRNCDLDAVLIITDGVLKSRMPLERESELRSFACDPRKGFEKCFNNISTAPEEHKDYDADDRAGVLQWYQNSADYQKSLKLSSSSSSSSKISVGDKSIDKSGIKSGSGTGSKRGSERTTSRATSRDRSSKKGTRESRRGEEEPGRGGKSEKGEKISVGGRKSSRK